MCGIIGITGELAAPVIIEGLRRLEYRGYDSAGLAVLRGGKINVVKTAGYVQALADAVGDDFPGDAGIGHTRWATHGAPSDENAHPHVSNCGKIALVHNGIIENYAQLRATLQDAGFTFGSETDTEVAVNLIQRCYDECGDIVRAVADATALMEGSYAFGVLCEDLPGTIIAAKRESPLIIGVGSGRNYIASDITAILARTRDSVRLYDGEVAVVTPGAFTIYSGDMTEIQREHETVDWDITAAEKGGYEHFMLKEIMEQPEAVRRTLSPRLKRGRVDLTALEIPDEFIRSVTRIYITACGTAAFAGMIAKNSFEKLARIPTEVVFASEFRYGDPILDEHTLVVCVSQSGTTADTIAAMREAKRCGSKVIAVVNVVGSVMAEEADWTMYMYAGPEISVASTKVYSTMIADAHLLALHFAAVRGTVAEGDYAAAVAALAELPARIGQTLALSESIRETAKLYSGNDDIYFIGRGADYALSLEGDQKLKEISYIHSEAYAAGELKHGPIALIDSNVSTPVVVVATTERVLGKTVSNAVEVKSRGARVLALVSESTREPFVRPGTDGRTIADDVITVPDFHPLFMPSLAIIPLQLFAYYVALERGTNIDKPRNLAKSVTVE